MQGLDIFKKFFAGYEENYILIGGTACTVLLDEVGLDFRATKDLDIVLIIENMSKKFAEKFWEFVKLAGYTNIFEGTAKGKFYRFEKPKDNSYPKMIELFSRAPFEYVVSPQTHLVPLHVAEDVSSLSAILLNDDYYQFLLDGRKSVSGISILGELHLIPFKAKAWCELKDRHKRGEEGLTKHIKKHIKDIAILMTLVGGNRQVNLKVSVLEDMVCFAAAMQNEVLDVHTTGVKNMSTEYYCKRLKEIYNLI